tara:strand:- start:3560 stop:4519 length:960 start_codon:yes stop_codon:yes gene_type:complete
MAKSKNIIISSIIFDKKLIDLCLRVHISLSNINYSSVFLELPYGLDDNSQNVKRIRNCLSFWLPNLIKLENKFSSCSVFKLNASDWPQPGYLSMVDEDTKNLIPDEYAMFESLNLDRVKYWENYNTFLSTWTERFPSLFWRGSTTGDPIKSMNELSNLLRVKVCIMYEKNKNMDLKITNIVQNNIPKSLVREWLKSKSIYSKRVREASFMKFKYYLDIPGNNKHGCSWGTIKKFLRGNLVFKPIHIQKLLYETDMEPYIHYIPIKTDYSDLDEVLHWAIDNESLASKIAWEGHLKSLDYLKRIDDIFIESCLSNISSFY